MAKFVLEVTSTLQLLSHKLQREIISAAIALLANLMAAKLLSTMNITTLDKPFFSWKLPCRTWYSSWLRHRTEAPANYERGSTSSDGQCRWLHKARYCYLYIWSSQLCKFMLLYYMCIDQRDVQEVVYSVGESAKTFGIPCRKAGSPIPISASL